MNNLKNTLTKNSNQLPNSIKGKYFIVLPEGIRYIFNSLGSQQEATYISLILAELHSLRYVQPKAASFGGNFMASISDISFYTGLPFDEIKKALLRLEASGVIIIAENIENLTEDDYHKTLNFKIDDNLIQRFTTIGEKRFIDAKNKHVAEKMEATKSTKTINSFAEETCYDF